MILVLPEFDAWRLVNGDKFKLHYNEFNDIEYKKHFSVENKYNLSLRKLMTSNIWGLLWVYENHFSDGQSSTQSTKYDKSCEHDYKKPLYSRKQIPGAYAKVNKK